MANTIGGGPVHHAGHEIAPGYLVVELLSRGDECDTYDVWSLERFCRCVIKTVRSDVDTPRARGALIREGRLALSLTHPYIVRCYELLRPGAPRPPALVLETLPGETLSYLLEESGVRLPDEQLGYLGRNLCSAVRYLHALGYLHLDIKPGNVICCDGRSKLIDLGLARPPGVSRPGAGTRTFMAPEQARGDALGPAADVWGIGLVLYQAATGHQPFDSEEPSISEGHRTTFTELHSHYPQLVLHAPRIRGRRRLPRPVAEIIDACLSPDPDRRPGTEQLDSAMAILTGEDVDRPGGSWPCRSVAAS